MLKNLVAMILRAGFQIHAYSEFTVTIIRDGKRLTVPATYSDIQEALA